MAATVAGAAANQYGTQFARHVAFVSLVPWCSVLLIGLAGVDLSLIGALTIVTTMHVGTTAAFYMDPEARHLVTGDPTRYVLLPVLLIGVGVASALWAPAPVFGLLFLGRVGWQVHHFNRQNLGMISMHSKALGRPGLTAGDRKTLDVAGFAAMAAVLGTEEWTPIVADQLQPHRGLILAAAIGLAGVALLMALRSRRVVLALAVVYWLPLLVYWDRPGLAVLAIGMTHAAQYYFMMLGLRGGRVQADARRMVCAVALCAVTIGLFHATKPFGTVGYGVYLGAGAAHFLIDANMWKMRAKPQRDYLTHRFAFLGQPVRL